MCLTQRGAILFTFKHVKVIYQTRLISEFNPLLIKDKRRHCFCVMVASEDNTIHHFAIHQPQAGFWRCYLVRHFPNAVKLVTMISHKTDVINNIYFIIIIVSQLKCIQQIKKPFDKLVWKPSVHLLVIASNEQAAFL